MQIFHLNLFFAGQDFSTPYMADDLDPYAFILKGYKTIQGFLRSESICVQRQRIRDSMYRLNPSRQTLRSMTVIRRRTYRVPSPLALWHIDGNHKLIR